MTIRLPRLTQGDVQLKSWANLICQRLESILTDQQETIDRIRRLFSHTEPTRIFTATDNGATATITVADHVRVYGDATTLSITGGSQSGLDSNTDYAGYYDDETLADTTPAYHFTKTIGDAQGAKAAGRHFLGVIKTPAAGSGDSRVGGGTYPAGSAPGGEV